MNEKAEQWVKALEGGTYKQGHSYLRHHGFCCLGVACDVHDSSRWAGANKALYFDPSDGKHRNDYLPMDLQRALGLMTPKGHFDPKSLPRPLLTELRGALGEGRAPGWLPNSLVALNDASIPFDLIAKVIRAEPTGLFVPEQQELLAS